MTKRTDIKPLILIAEDEPAQVEVLRYNLEKADFRVAIASNGAEAWTMVQEEMPDVAVLDWMMPEMSGVDLCRRLRAKPDTKALPIIMLTARGEEADRVQGLDSGADDYMVKPYSPKELVARIRALLRRLRPAFTEEKLEYGGIELDLSTRKVFRDGKPIALGPTEFRLLWVLMERPERVFSREKLLDLAWGQNIHVEPRTVDVHIRRLRQALNAEEAADIVRTVRGAGYALDAHTAA